MDGGIDLFNGFGDGFLRPSTLHNTNNEPLTRSIQENIVDYAQYYSVNSRLYQKLLTNLNDKLGNNFTKLMTKKAV